jgi:DNA-binding GntR family transcriptional regulator
MEAKTATGRPAIVNVLREAIRQGLLAPGQPLIQASIADAMGVSRITIYNYLNALENESDG